VETLRTVGHALIPDYMTEDGEIEKNFQLLLSVLLVDADTSSQDSRIACIILCFSFLRLAVSLYLNVSAHLHNHSTKTLLHWYRVQNKLQVITHLFVAAIIRSAECSRAKMINKKWKRDKPIYLFNSIFCWEIFFFSAGHHGWFCLGECFVAGWLNTDLLPQPPYWLKLKAQ